MRNFLLGLPLSLLLVQAGFGACVDTTIIIKSGGVGYGGGIYDPDAGGALNSIIAGCPDSLITVHLHLDAGLANLKDTLRLAHPIKIDRPNKTTVLTGVKSTTSPPAGILDTLFTFLEKDTAQPALLSVAISNRALISNFGFARKANNGTHSVTIAGKGSTISGCHFWMLDNSSNSTGSLLELQGDSILVERCLFRAPPNGQGRSIAIHTSGSAQKLEIRSNAFFSTGLQLTIGSFHIYANTFAGSRNGYNCIIVGNGVTTPEASVVIQHNLFVPKIDLLPPIAFSGNPTTSDNIQRNAWSRSDPNLALAVNGTGTALTLNGATAGNVNTPLSRGFSNYGPTAPDIQDFPLTELRTDTTLAANNPDFGKVYRVYTTTNWTSMQDVKDGLPASKLYFPNFSPFIAGRTWVANTKVGAFVDADILEVPSPLDSGSQGSALKFNKYAQDSTKITNTRMSFNQDYYKSNITPEFMYYFFSNTLSKLTTSNDSAVLKAAVGPNAFIRKAFLGDDGLLTVPKEVRSGGDIFVKMLHYRKSWQAPVLSTAAIATVTGVPSFPANDLQLSIVAPGPTDYSNGIVALNVTHGAEAIDSIRVVASHDNGVVEATLDKAVTGAGSLSFGFTLPKGTYYFYALPMAKLSGAIKLGQPTANSSSITLRSVAGDTIYVSYKSGGCTGADGSVGNPFCSLDSALQAINQKGGGSILIRNGSPVVAMEDITIGSVNAGDTAAVLISNMISSGKYDENRPIFRGKTKEALTITRKNVTLKGFVIEMPAGSTGRAALSVKNSGAVIDGNIFRSQSKSLGVEGPAVNIDIGSTAEMRFINNVTWGMTKAVQVTNSSSSGIRILNNTFLDDKSFPNSGSVIGVTVVGTALNAVIANNFFSNIALPYDSSVTKKTPTLDHNVYTFGANLLGLTDAGNLDSNQSVRTVDLTSATYVADLDNALSDAFSCSSIHPCPSLQAASSTSDYKTPVNTDVIGKARTNKKDVGAYEIVLASNTALGRLAINATPPTAGQAYDKIGFQISSKNFDSTEADVIHVWWTTSPASVLDTTIPASRQKTYPISKLNLGAINDTATGLVENTLYYFYATFGRNGAKSLTPVYVSSDTATSGINFQAGDCKFETSETICPSKDGFFVSIGGGVWDGKFQTRITMANKAESGSVIHNPAFESVGDANVFNLDLTSPLPVITLGISVPSLGVAGSTQTFTASIEMDYMPNLAGKELFLLPGDSSSLPTHVSTWQLVQEGGKTKLIIEGTKGGTLRYAFGKLAAAAEPGQIRMADAAAPVFDYSDTATQVSFPITGTGFKTSNPLVLVSLVPAGGMSQGVLSGKYPTSTLALSSDISELPTDLRTDRFYRYFLKAVRAESTYVTPSGHNKPMTLDSVTSDTFTSSVIETSPSLVLAGNGTLTSGTTISVPMSKKFKDAESGRKASRSVEVVFTVFDGSKLSRTSGFIRSKFKGADLQLGDEIMNLGKKQFDHSKWNLFGYPWDEADTGSQARIVGAQRWDHDHMRLMKYKGTGTGASSFITYDGSTMDKVQVDSGRAVWAGSASPFNAGCASGISLDYQTFSLPLTGGQWNDISLPFNFPIKLKDILDSSNLGTPPPAIWRYLVSADKTSWEALDGKSTLYPWDGLTVRPAANVTLRIPVLDSSRSNTSIAGPKSAAKSENQWTANLEAFNETASMALHVGKGGIESVYGEPPDVPGQDFRMVLKRPTPDGGGENLSAYIQSENGTWQGQWPLKASAVKGTQGLFLRLTDNAKGKPIYLVETLHKTAVQLSQDSVHISEADLNANDYHLVAGDAQFLQEVMEGLSPEGLLKLSNYPNPFSGSTLIRYALPASFGKVDFLLRVRDFRGRVVFEKSVQAANVLSFVWDGRSALRSPLPAGVYTLSLEAKAAGKPAYKATRRLLKM